MSILFKKNISIKDSKYIPSSFFTDDGWLSVIEKSFEYKRKYIFFKDKEKLELILPTMQLNIFTKKIFASLPFSFNLDIDELNENILIKKLLRNNFFIKNSEFVVKSSFKNIDDKNKDYFKSKFNFYTVDLKENFNKNFSNNITRSLKKILNITYREVEKFNSPEFDTFFENYILSSKKLQTFFFPKNFFFNLFKYCGKKFYIINAYEDKTFLGGHLILLDNFKKEVIYFCSSKSKLGQKISIDKILLNYSMHKCSKELYNTFNLGKVSKKDFGLNNFKKQFGSKQKELNYFSLLKNNYAVLDQNSLKKKIICILIRFMPKILYKKINNKIFKYLALF